MKTNPLIDALRSLKDRFCKNIRTFMISFWFVLANTVGFLIWLRFVFIHDDSGMPMIRPHPYSHYSFWIFIVGLPILVVILGILGYLPGTRKKKLEI